MTYKPFIILCLISVVGAGYVFKKSCRDVGTSQCSIHNVVVEPCVRGPSFCTFNSHKLYTISVDFTPYFAAHDTRISISTNTNVSETFTPVKYYKDACRNILTCPVGAEVRQLIDLPISFEKKAGIKFPVEVKIWNAENESEACCFTFRAKVK